MKEIKTFNQESAFQITSFEQAERFATMFANSDFAPRDFKGKPANVLIAMQLGNELGLKPIQAVQNICVLNGRACVWGDLALALVRANPECHGVKEWIEGSFKDGNAVAYCEVMRNSETIKESFSVEMAKRAGLLGKQGPWSQYPERMLAMRARGFALRNAFPDALKGVYIREEMEGSDSKFKAKTVNSIQNIHTIQDVEYTECSFDPVSDNNFAEQIEACNSTLELKGIGSLIAEANLSSKEVALLKNIYKDRLEILKEKEDLDSLEFPNEVSESV